MKKEQNSQYLKIKKRLTLADTLDPNKKRYLLLDNFENIYRRSDVLSTQKINVIEEKIKTDSNTSRTKLHKSNDINNHCLFKKECIYYKKFKKLKKEIDNILNINKKLNLFNKSLYLSLQQKTKDYQYLMKENSLLKKAILKLNGLTYKEILKNKFKDFRNTSKNIYYKKIQNTSNNNSNIIKLKNYSLNYKKRNLYEKLTKYNNKQKNTKTIYTDNKKVNTSRSSDSLGSKDLEGSYFKNVTHESQNFIKKMKNKSNNNYNVNPIIKQNSNSKDLSNNMNISPYKTRNSESYFKVEDSPNKHYESIKKFNMRKGRSSTIFTQKYSLLSLKIDLFIIMNNNLNLTKLQNLISSDEHFLSSLRNASENQLLKYSDLISCLINDYKEMIKISMRMKEFMKSSISLVDSIISNDSSKVFIDNTCTILNCDRASLFVLDQISDSLIIYTGEGVKKAQIKVPKDKGIVGACFMEGKKIRIDDAYNDQRFNKDVDLRTNYKTKSILCYPLKDNDEKCFGVIEAINKFNSPFNDDDEELLKLLSHQASTIFKNQFYNDNNNKFYINKLFTLMRYYNKIFHIKNKKEFSEKTEEFLLNLFNCMISAIFFVENDKFIKYNKDDENRKEYKNNIGIVGKVFKSKEVMAYESIKKSKEFNSIIDLESPSGLLAFPILEKKTNNVCAVIEVPFAGDVNNFGKPKEKEMILIKYLSKCIKNWIFNLENDNNQ